MIDSTNNKEKRHPVKRKAWDRGEIIPASKSKGRFTVLEVFQQMTVLRKRYRLRWDMLAVYLFVKEQYEKHGVCSTAYLIMQHIELSHNMSTVRRVNKNLLTLTNSGLLESFQDGKVKRYYPSDGNKLKDVA